MEIDSKSSRQMYLGDITYCDPFPNPTLFKENKLNYITTILLALPSIQYDFKEGNFKVEYKGDNAEYKGKIINILIRKIEDKAQDPILLVLNNSSNVGNFGPKHHYPPEFYTDNRGKYPYYCAQIEFPFLLADWYDPNTRGSRKLIDHERAEITGGYKHEGKIDALSVLNQLFSSKDYNKNKPLVYEDVTLFIEQYFIKNNFQLVLIKINIFASRDAYKNSMEYFFGSVSEKYISENIEKHRAPEILTETDLLEYILQILNKTKHLIEDLNSTHQFWDSEQKVKKDGKFITVPAKPKDETQIQPTLYVLFYCLFDPRITVDRETNEGIGELDFKFRHTTNDGKQLILCLEFKLAHHQRIKDGLTKQLPAYLKANESTVGIFTVMWFKDEGRVFFKKPSNRNKEQMLGFLEETSNDLYRNKGLNIKIV
jgi:hypothetical protein